MAEQLFLTPTTQRVRHASAQASKVVHGSMKSSFGTIKVALRSEKEMTNPSGPSHPEHYASASRRRGRESHLGTHTRTSGLPILVPISAPFEVGAACFDPEDIVRSVSEKRM